MFVSQADFENDCKLRLNLSRCFLTLYHIGSESLGSSRTLQLSVKGSNMSKAIVCLHILVMDHDISKMKIINL